MSRQTKTICGVGGPTRTVQSIRNVGQTDPLPNESGAKGEERAEAEHFGPSGKKPLSGRIGWFASRVGPASDLGGRNQNQNLPMNEKQNNLGKWEGLPLVGTGGLENHTTEARRITARTRPPAHFPLKNPNQRVIDPKPGMIFESILAFFQYQSKSQKGDPSCTTAHPLLQAHYSMRICYTPG